MDKLNKENSRLVILLDDSSKDLSLKSFLIELAGELIHSDNSSLAEITENSKTANAHNNDIQNYPGWTIS